MQNLVLKYKGHKIVKTSKPWYFIYFKATGAYLTAETIKDATILIDFVVSKTE